MPKIKTNVPVLNRLTGEPFRNADGATTFKKIVVDSLNVPPHILPPVEGANPKHKAELRAGIIEKLLSGDESDFRPDETDEILFVVSAIQPPMLYTSIKSILEGSNDQMN